MNFAVIGLGSFGVKRAKAIKSSKNAKLVTKGFNYSSGKNPHFLTVEELRKLIVTNLDIEL